MPRFHFEVRGSDHFPDPEGVVLKDLAAARREVARLSSALMRDYPEAFAKARSWDICIVDDSGAILEVQSFEGPPPRPIAND